MKAHDQGRVGAGPEQGGQSRAKDQVQGAYILKDVQNPRSLCDYYFDGVIVSEDDGREKRYSFKDGKVVQQRETSQEGYCQSLSYTALPLPSGGATFLYLPGGSNFFLKPSWSVKE